MGIEIRPSGESVLYGQAAKKIGEAERTEREIQSIERTRSQLLSIQAQKEMAEFNRQLEVERLKYHAAMNLEEEKRARAWQLEKMEIASRLDFERDEVKRQKAMDAYDAVIKKIDDTDIIDDSTKDNLKFKEGLKLLAYAEAHGLRLPARVIFPEAYSTKKSALSLLESPNPSVSF